MTIDRTTWAEAERRRRKRAFQYGNAMTLCAVLSAGNGYNTVRFAGEESDYSVYASAGSALLAGLLAIGAAHFYKKFRRYHSMSREARSQTRILER